MKMPKCPKCEKGELIPFSKSDYYSGTVFHKWKCTNPKCNYEIKD